MTMKPTTREEAEKMNLYTVTIRRVYTEVGQQIWSDAKKRPEQDSDHPEWGWSAEGVAQKWDVIHSRKSDYWDAKYKDHAVAVVEIDKEAAREARRDYVNRVISRVYGERYQPCCDLAVIRPCVCAVSYVCPQHGISCHGSHD